MRNKAILFSLILVASGSVLAEQSLLEGAAKQAITDTATNAAPTAVKSLDTANQTLENAKNLSKDVEKAPAALQDQAKKTAQESAKKTLDAATPEAAKKSVEAVKTGTKTAENLKAKVDKAPKSTKAVSKKTAEKALNLLQ
jgi:outer membrane biosynthesis protein TonB